MTRGAARLGAGLAGLVALLAIVTGCGVGSAFRPSSTATVEVAATVVAPPAATPTESPPATPTPTPAPARPVVVLDPGHGGEEIGAADHGLVEKDSNLDMALRTETYLRAAGVDVVLTRREDARASAPGSPTTGYAATRADLLARVRIANTAHADVFVAIHSNGSSDASQRGIEVYYDSRRPFADQNEALAQTLLDGALQGLVDYGAAPTDRGIMDSACWQEYRGHCVGLYVLSPAGTTTVFGADARPGALATEPAGSAEASPAASASATPRARLPKEATEMPGALVELLFLSNAQDAALLRSDGARDALARGLANGILQYLGARQASGLP